MKIGSLDHNTLMMAINILYNLHLYSYVHILKVNDLYNMCCIIKQFQSCIINSKLNHKFHILLGSKKIFSN